MIVALLGIASCLLRFYIIHCRPGITVMEVDSLSPGEYIITPTTYTEGQEGPFFITAFADGAFDFQAV